MTEFQQRAIAEIEKQQTGMEKYSCPYVVGEQLKEICMREPKSAELLANDLQVKEMDLYHAERKIDEYGKSLMKGKTGGVAISPVWAEKVLRDFYKLPEAGTAGQAVAAEEPKSKGKIIDLDDFFT